MTTKNPINPKNALTYGTVLGYIGEEFTVLKIKLETGRTHQIRVHLASIGYPIIGDSVYGNIDINKQVARKYNLYRQALHAYELELDLYGEKKVFVAEYKQDMRNILDTINL